MWRVRVITVSQWPASRRWHCRDFALSSRLVSHAAVLTSAG
jgi:hypothetical protein